MKRRAETSVWRDYGITLTAAVLFALGIRFFGFEAYRIPTPAMRPTLEPGDTIFVSKYAYGLRLPGNGKHITQGRTPQRGEVVLFSMPGDGNRDYIKRIIAMPGELVAVTQGKVYIDGKLLAVKMDDIACGLEALPGNVIHPLCWEPPTLPDFGPKPVPKDSVFVLGDLRSQSDSPRGRVWNAGSGFVPISQIRGKAMWIWLSIRPRSFDPSGGGGSRWFPQFRFERMFRRIQ